MDHEQIAALERFLVKAKSESYVGGGKTLLSYRQGSHDLQFHEGEWAYHDSYFGGWDFLGEEVAYFQGDVVWGMNYYGRILNPEKISAGEAGQLIKRSLSAMYAEGRFLGGWSYTVGNLCYTDSNEGDIRAFEGHETIERDGLLVYRLAYHGGTIR